MGTIQIYDLDNSHYVSISAPDSITTTTTYKLPPEDGSNGEVLKTDGSGNLSWTSNSGGGSSTAKVWIAFGKNGTLTGSISNRDMTTKNGSTNGQGYRIPSACTAKKISLQCDCLSVSGTREIKAIIWKNGSEQINDKVTLSISSTGDKGDTGNIDCSFSANDTLNVKLTLDSNISADDFAVIVELDIS